MKKLLFFIVVLVFFVCMGFSQSVTITSPNGGENWTLGSKHQITWTSSGVTGNVKLILFQNGTKLGNIVLNLPVTQSSYTWSVGTHSNGVATLGTGFSVKIRAANGGYSDASNGSFSIKKKPVFSIIKSVTIKSPNGGENWTLGSKHQITWTSSGVTGNVKLILFQNGTKLGNIVLNLPVTQSSYTWLVGSHSNGVATPGTGFSVKIRAASGGYSDFSNGSFSIKKKKNLSNLGAQNNINNIRKNGIGINVVNNMILPIKIIKPDGDDWKEGTSHRIKWERKTIGSKGVDIYLVDYYGKKIIKTIKKNLRTMPVPNFSGGNNNKNKYCSYMWNIPKNIYKWPGNYKIKIVRVDGKAKGLSKSFHISIVTKVKKYKIYAATSNKFHRRGQSKKVPLTGGVPFITSYEHKDPGNGKLRVGYANFYKKDIIAYNYSGYIYRAHAFFNVSQFKGKGLMTKAVLHFSHYKGNSCGVKVFEVTKTTDSFFNIETNFIENSHNNIVQIVRRWVAYPNSNFGVLFTGTNESYSHNNSKCVDYYDNVYLEIEIIERNK